MFYLLHFWCSDWHLVKAQHCLYNSGIKVDILDECGAMICSYFGIAFELFFVKIENAAYTSCQNSTLLFINGLISDIMNTQNNQSLEFELKPMLALHRAVNDRRFSWLRNVFLMSSQDWVNSVQHRQGNFTKIAGQKIFIFWQTYEGLKTSANSIIQATQFLLWHQVKYALAERFCQDPLGNWFGRQSSLGSRTTERFCQDPLENWFGRQRRLGSRKDNPSMADFGCNNNAMRNQQISNQSLMVMLLIVAWLL